MQVIDCDLMIGSFTLTKSVIPKSAAVKQLFGGEKLEALDRDFPSVCRESRSGQFKWTQGECTSTKGSGVVHILVNEGRGEWSHLIMDDSLVGVLCSIGTFDSTSSGRDSLFDELEFPILGLEVCGSAAVVASPSAKSQCRSWDLSCSSCSPISVASTRAEKSSLAFWACSCGKAVRWFGRPCVRFRFLTRC